MSVSLTAASTLLALYGRIAFNRFMRIFACESKLDSPQKASEKDLFDLFAPFVGAGRVRDFI